jgi:cytochrome c peroxidase
VLIVGMVAVALAGVFLGGEQLGGDQLVGLSRSTFGVLPKVAWRKDRVRPSAAQISLGRMLYYERRLSADGEISCNTCHPLDRHGADAQARSPAVGGRRTKRNTPTLYNVAFHKIMTWDGVDLSVEEMSTVPLLGAAHGMKTEDRVEEVLRGIPGYERPFEAGFPGEEEPITFDNVGSALGAFVRTLITRSRFDDFMEGDSAALSPREREGLQTFILAGCATCHTGATIGGNSAQKLGAKRPYPCHDTGKYQRTGETQHLCVFKVPSLRHVANTGPYLHDGSVADLSQVVRLMGHYQLGKELRDDEVGSIVAFLGALTGRIEPGHLARPVLPE